VALLWRMTTAQPSVRDSLAQSNRTVFDVACEMAGGRSRVANLIDLTRGRIDQVARGEGEPKAEWCVLLERETEGTYTCEQINPGICWVRSPDPAWPWHPGGRPLIDPAPEATAATATEAQA